MRAFEPKKHHIGPRDPDHLPRISGTPLFSQSKVLLSNKHRGKVVFTRLGFFCHLIYQQATDIFSCFLISLGVVPRAQMATARRHNCSLKFEFQCQWCINRNFSSFFPDYHICSDSVPLTITSTELLYFFHVILLLILHSIFNRLIFKHFLEFFKNYTLKTIFF